MTIISLIAAIDESRGLGYKNKLLCHLPADLKHFKALTLGKPVIMGRKTYESIGKALPGRLNIVLSAKQTVIEDATVVSSLEQALALTSIAEEVMVIGGAKVFDAALLFADRIYLTIIHHQFIADAFFPLLNREQWHIEETGVCIRDDKNNYDMTFYRYDKIAAKHNECSSK